MPKVYNLREYQDPVVRRLFDGQRQAFLNGRDREMKSLRRMYRVGADQVEALVQRMPRRNRLSWLKEVEKKATVIERQMRQEMNEIMGRSLRSGVASGTAAPNQLSNLRVSLTSKPISSVQLSVFMNDVEKSLLNQRNVELKKRVRKATLVWKRSAIGFIRNQIEVESKSKKRRTARSIARDTRLYLMSGNTRAGETGFTRGFGARQKRAVRNNPLLSTNPSYHGTRILMTEAHEAHYRAKRAALRIVPGYRGSFWRLSGLHKVADICDDYASNDGDGFWRKGTEPSRPHPFCACDLIPVFGPEAQDDTTADPSTDRASRRSGRQPRSRAQDIEDLILAAGAVELLLGEQIEHREIHHCNHH